MRESVQLEEPAGNGDHPRGGNRDPSTTPVTLRGAVKLLMLNEATRLPVVARSFLHSAIGRLFGYNEGRTFSGVLSVPGKEILDSKNFG